LLGFEAAYILLSMRRLLKVGTTQEFEEGRAESIFNTPLAGILGPGLLLAVPALFYTAKKASQ